MKQNNFYEVDGCTDFIPVTINETYADGVGVIVSDTMQDYRLLIEQVYRFPKVNEPQKVTVPKFVADFYESIKDDFENKVYDLCVQYNRDNGELSSEVDGWFDFEKNEPIQTLVKMKLYGYEVEQEKLYTAEIAEAILTKITRGSNIQYKMLPFGNVTDVFDKAIYTTRLTEQEIKQKDERLWQFAKEVE